jgi:uncharacterized membrane protein YkoI
MKRFILWGMIVLLFSVIGNGNLIAEEEREIPVDKIPAKVKAVLFRIFPKIKITEAEIEKTKSGDVYEIEGKVDGKEYEIEIKADGTLIRVELEEEDDDEDDD